MKLHRFYRPEFQKEMSVSGSLITVHDSAVLHQLVKVLRLEEGGKIIFFSENVPDTEVVIQELSLKEGVFLVEEQALVAAEPERRVTLVIPPLRKERLEWLVEKASELGVRALWLASSDKAQPRGYSMDRLEKIAIEAAEQCGRQSLLKIEEKGTVKEVAEEAKGIKVVADIPDVSQEGWSAQEDDNKEPVFIFIGPEGGWSDEEREFFKEKRLQSLTLGSLVLRAETAAIVASSSFTV